MLWLQLPKNVKSSKDLPVGIIGSLLITTIVYVLVALVLTGMQKTSGPVPFRLFKSPNGLLYDDGKTKLGSRFDFYWFVGWFDICTIGFGNGCNKNIVLQ